MLYSPIVSNLAQANCEFGRELVNLALDMVEAYSSIISEPADVLQVLESYGEEIPAGLDEAIFLIYY